MKNLWYYSIKRNRGAKAKLIVFLYYLGSGLRRKSKPLYFLYRPIYLLLTDYILGVEIPLSTNIGPGLRIYHGRGIVINAYSTLGKDVTLYHNVTIGSTGIESQPDGLPKVGNNVIVYCNSTIIGPVTVGDNAIIGAHNLVIKNVKKNSKLFAPTTSTSRL